MPQPPQSILDIELLDAPDDGDDPYAPVIQAMFQQWDSYAYDPGFHDWVSEFLRGILPKERIIRRQLPLPGPLPPWIWVNGKYTKNELYEKNEAIP